MFFEAFLLNICVIEKFLLILQRETMDDNHSSAGKCIFCRAGGGYEGRKDRNAKRGGEAEKNEAGESTE